MTDYEQALCRQVDADMFFPGKGDGETSAMARRVCACCPIREACLEDNIHELYGVWGGTTEMLRRKLRRQRGIDLREADVCKRGHDRTIPGAVTLGNHCRRCKQEQDAASQRRRYAKLRDAA